MTREEIWKWQEEMFVFSCYLYEVEDDAVLSDWLYDQHCQMLLKHYATCSPEFRARVDRARLSTGTASGMTYTAEEIEGARAWRRRCPKPSTSSQPAS